MFIVWLAWRKKRSGTGLPFGGYIVQIPGDTARKRTNPLLIILLFVAVIVALFWGADWLNLHLPSAPGNR